MEPASAKLPLEDQDAVSLVVTPAFLRVGDQNGEDYGSVCILKKSRVLPMARKRGS
jgi:hypothetical protein